MAEVQSQGPPSKPTKLQPPSVARHVAGRNSAPCQLLCGVFSSPYSSLSYFWGDNFLKHVALQVHVKTQKANRTWVSAQTGMSGLWLLHIFTIKRPVIIFSTTCMIFFFIFFYKVKVNYHISASSARSRAAQVVIYERCLRHLRRKASGLIAIPHFSCSYLATVGSFFCTSLTTAKPAGQRLSEQRTPRQFYQ